MLTGLETRIVSFEWAILGRLAAACLLGGLLGLQREVTRHSAGLRTHMLVAVSAAGFAIVGILIGDAHPTSSGDLARIIQGIITGVGFIGAGAIMKGGGDVHGLTTAASLWVAAALGVMVAMDFYILAIASAIIAALVLMLPSHRDDQDTHNE